MIRGFSVIIEKDEDGRFLTSIPDCLGCHTKVKPLDVLMKRVGEAIKLCLGIEEYTSTEFVGVH